MATLAEQYARTTLLGESLGLPGPTGERNTLAFASRGAVVCAASTRSVLLNQVAAALATGNIAVVPEFAADAVPADLPREVLARIERVTDIASFNGEFQIALVEPALAARLRGELAARTGSIVGVVETVDAEAIPLWRLVAERALCVNTTAAGGNASLMTLGL